MEEVQHQDETTRAAGPATERRGIPPVVAGLVVLLLGVLVGILIRPLMISQHSNASPATSGRAAGPSSGQTRLMDAAIAQTRHFKGDSNAPVTIIEFSDFQ